MELLPAVKQMPFVGMISLITAPVPRPCTKTFTFNVQTFLFLPPSPGNAGEKEEQFRICPSQIPRSGALEPAQVGRSQGERVFCLAFLPESPTPQTFHNPGEAEGSGKGGRWARQCCVFNFLFRGKQSLQSHDSLTCSAFNVRWVFSSGGHSVFHKLQPQHQQAPEHHRSLESLGIRRELPLSTATKHFKPDQLNG